MIEKITFDAIAQKPYKLMLGGEEFEFRPISFSDRQEISSIVAEIPELIVDFENDPDELITKKAIDFGKYAKQIAQILSVGAHIRGSECIEETRRAIPFFPFWNRKVKIEIKENERRKKLFEHIYKNANIEEIYLAMRYLITQSRPAFFLDIFISLIPENTLKQTKETEVIHHG